MFDKRLMKLCPESKKYIAGNILLQWLELLLNALMVLQIAEGIRILWERSGTGTEGIWPLMWPRLLIILLTILLRSFTARLGLRMSYLASRTVKRVLREEIYGKLLRLGNSWREHVSTAELVQESVEGVEQLESYFGQYVPQFFYAFLAPLTLLVLFGLAGSWTVGLVLLICVPLIPGAIMMVQKIAKKILAKYWDQYTGLGSRFLENLQGMTSLKIYQTDGVKHREMNEESENFRKVTMKVLTMQLNSIIIMDLFAYGGAALGIFLALRALGRGQIGLDACIFMLLLSAEFFLPMRRLGSYFHVAMNGLAASDKIFRFLGEEERTGAGRELPAGGGDLLLEQVSFSYDEERNALEDVSLSIPRGQMIGLAGESGSGKSSVAVLLMGRRLAGGGRVLLAGIPSEDIEEASRMQYITYVGTEPFLFKGSVADNLRLAAPGASEEELWQVLEQVSLAGLFREQEGLETPLRENASNLSGGERQRLALARALLHNSPVYIFDEATSNIDAESEELILKQIFTMAGKKTVLLISHRLANLVRADKIYCLKKGRISGEGTHEELLKAGGAYARLWHTQQALENFGREAV